MSDANDAERTLARHAQGSPLEKILHELERVEGEPRLLVIVTHGLIELMVNEIVKAKCKHGKDISNDNRSFPHSIKVTLLHELGVLSDHHFTLLTWFRKLRNDCVHKWNYTVTNANLDNLVKPEHRDPTKFRFLCRDILIDLWQSHEMVVGPVVIPNAYTVTTTSQIVMLEILPPPTYLIPLKTDPKDVRVQRPIPKSRPRTKPRGPRRESAPEHP